MKDNTKNSISKDRLVTDLKNLGVRPGDLLNLKISLKSIGWIEGGASTVLDAILEVIGKKGTIVSDSFVKAYPLGLLRRSKMYSDKNTPSYAGAIANTMIKRQDSFRSNHPIQRFTAIGHKAQELMNNHGPDDYAYDVLRVMAESGGKNLKIGKDGKVIGVGTTHVAIGLLGFKQKYPKVGIYYKEKGEDKLFKRNWSGGCEKGFSNFAPLYAQNGGILSKGYVGEAEAQLSDMKKTLDLELSILKEDPTFFFCDNPKCIECRYSWEFSNAFAKDLKLLFLRKYINLKRRIL